MNTNTFFKSVLVAVLIVLGAALSKAGNAYGRRTSTGLLVVFAYTNTQVTLDLSQGHPNDRYNIECSTNCTVWSLVTLARLSSRGDFRYVYTNTVPYCYYRVIPTP